MIARLLASGFEARRGRPVLRRFLSLAVVGAALVVAGCSTSPSRSSSSGLAVEGRAELLSQRDLQRAAGDWERRYERNPNDRVAALNYGAALRGLGRHGQAVAILRRAVLAHEGDREIQAAYAKALTSAGRFEEALQVISQAHSPARPDWQLLSAQGTILDQLGRHPEARRAYAEALQVRPDEPTVLSNLGMSYVLEGNLPEAERTLRQAIAVNARVDPRVRGNLAMVVGLQGRFDEAMQIAQQDLPRQAAEANIAFLRAMLSEGDRWGQLETIDG
ncbi:MAG: tetratricopeptide repeat protein [Pseudomonadota bacterium]